ncbi:hypothetical protein [Paenibacillus terrae]|uniref:hypothetical protein n=1 Tax=Paenibacillus terrae TaxID=159743 RepID=UPI000B32C97C|nr:hypothetical protein [Paenibacillus terrae]
MVQPKLRLVGEINSDLIEEAWQQLAKTHESLRSVFRYIGIEKPNRYSCTEVISIPHDDQTKIRFVIWSGADNSRICYHMQLYHH